MWCVEKSKVFCDFSGGTRDTESPALRLGTGYICDPYLLACLLLPYIVRVLLASLLLVSTDDTLLPLLLATLDAVYISLSS